MLKKTGLIKKLLRKKIPVILSVLTVSWQLGLSDLEMDEVMRGPAIARRAQQQQQQQQRKQSHQVADAGGGRPVVAQRDIADDDVCPICQEEFMDKKLPVTFCKSVDKNAFSLCVFVR